MIDKLLFLETMNVCQRINESQDKKKRFILFIK